VAADYPHPELAEATIASLQAKLNAGELTSRELAGFYVDRVEALDRDGPRLRSVIELNPDLDELADRLDRERAAGTIRGPLHGIPVMVKDNVDTGDRMLTTAGSLALAEAPAATDARVAADLRAAGAILLGKTNLSEWANFRSVRSSSGWSGRGRQTRNPYVLDRSPYGSSSGSGVAAAAGLAAAAVGTETDGSIVCPASANSVVGIKPTVGLLSQDGIVPISASQDSAGPLARTVADAALLLDAMTGFRFGYARLCRGPDLRGIRIGVLRGRFTGYSEHTDLVFEQALGALLEAGASLIDPVPMPAADELGDSQLERTVLLYEFKAGLNCYLGARADVAVHSLEELIEFNRNHAAVEMPYFGQELLEQSQAKGSLHDPEYVEAAQKSRALARERGIDAALAGHGLDALCAPTKPPPFVVDVIDGDRQLGGSSQAAAVAGYPIVSVPAGYALGDLPVGISFFAGAGSEGLLIRIAHGFEQATTARHSPRYLPTLELL
jgi:amidase